MLDSRQRVAFAPDVVLQVVDGEALLLKLDDEAVFTLNDTGARIAQLIAEGRDLEAMAEILGREYGLDRAEIITDTRALVEVLLVRGLVVLRSAEGS